MQRKAIPFAVNDHRPMTMRTDGMAFFHDIHLVLSYSRGRTD